MHLLQSQTDRLCSVDTIAAPCLRSTSAVPLAETLCPSNRGFLTAGGQPRAARDTHTHDRRARVRWHSASRSRLGRRDLFGQDKNYVHTLTIGIT